MNLGVHHITFSILVLCSVNCFAQVTIQKLTVNGKTRMFDAKHPIKLAALDDDVIFEFSAPKNASTTYYYQLQGLDKQWVSTKLPTTRYTNLSGDNYFFRLKAITNGVETSVYEQKIIVERTIIEEWWFVPVVMFYTVLLVSFAIYIFILFNFRQKLNVQRIRNRIAADLHDEVGATLSSIAISAKLVQKKLGSHALAVQPILDRIKIDTEDSILSIRDTVWTINPDNDSEEKLFEKIRAFAFQILVASNITLHFENEISAESSVKISMEQRRNIYMIFKEAINNIAKHSEANLVFVQICRHKSHIQILITDNGKGFNQHETFDGNGMKNFQRRANESFIDFQITSKIGKGTQILMVVPEL